MESGPSQGRSSPPKGRPVYLIGGSEYGRHKRNLSHSALQIGVAEIADTNANLKQIAEYELTTDTCVLTLKIKAPNTVAMYQKNYMDVEIAKKDQVEGAIKKRHNAEYTLTIDTWVFLLKNKIPN